MATLNTIDKVGLVLDLFTRERPEWGVSEVAAELKSPRSSVHALLASLAEIGLLRWRPGGRYRVGWRVLELADVHYSSRDLRAVARPVLERLVAEHGETCHLAVAQQRQVMYIDRYVGTHNVTVSGMPVGKRSDPHCTGVGKVLMAHIDAAEMANYLATTPLKRYTPNTITDPEAMTAELARIRARGVGYDLGEAVSDVYCVAAPIRDDLGDVIAAISLSSPVSRFEKKKEAYTRSVKTAADEISRQLAASQAIEHAEVAHDFSGSPVPAEPPAVTA
ncbi:DNA-binding transcriptional regulator, IclR family [Raineyella antarctica]|uniref:DNA-binding transcriptional regulator, IclR family n=1 Tax=Raineyella antarctica TaxID=1577474 RepID=A0A1G6GHW1_9ACTN|nr:IclR family transcriptional regulator [Raineyella antarctica]SDB81612.1 DNA-binding transcriptional regulator, IclR family [Raineyella antarctica]